MKKVCIVGHFGFGKDLANGQTIKTKNLTSELEKIIGQDEIIKIDTHGGARRIPIVLYEIVKAFCRCKNILMLPAQNGVILFGILFALLKVIFHKKIHYVVIGGWLPKFLKKKSFLSYCLKQFDHIYVEANTMNNLLVEQGFKNIVVMPNFKDIPILSKDELVYDHQQPYKLCTFSRVMKEKGIEDAVNVVTNINEKNGKIVCTLDIYGPVDENQIDWFEQLQGNFPNYIKYKGVAPAEKSVNILKTYYILLFPTYYFWEGLPGTIIDAYAAGVPVLASKWTYFEDIVDDEITGYGFEYRNSEDFQNKLEMLLHENIQPMKQNCIEKSREYLPENVIKTLTKNLL